MSKFVFPTLNQIREQNPAAMFWVSSTIGTIRSELRSKRLCREDDTILIAPNLQTAKKYAEQLFIDQIMDLLGSGDRRSEAYRVTYREWYSSKRKIGDAPVLIG